MAHLNMLREFHAWGRSWRESLPLDCLLCRNRTPRGLCRHCRDAVTASMRGQTDRCPRCGLGLSGAGVASPLVAEAVQRAALRMGVADSARHAALHTAGPACPDCQALSPALFRVLGAFDYHWPGDLLIHRLKRRRNFHSAPVLAWLLADHINAQRAAGAALWCPERTLVTAVPASSASLILRGFNPAAEVGRMLARQLGLAWRPDLVLRVREGGRQKQLDRQARQRGVQGLYRCPGGVAGREVLVVDDVMTTGSTLDAIAQVLAGQCAFRVWGAVLARTPSRTLNAGA